MKNLAVAKAAMVEVEAAQISITGRVRAVNQDYLGRVEPEDEAGARSHGWLYVLADGVGGAEDGEVAARAAVEQVCAGFRAAAPGEAPGKLLRRLVQAANLHVHQLARSYRAGGSSMATTIVACLVREGRAHIAHAGDSRAYHLREGRARVLTRDHTRGMARLWPWRRDGANRSSVLVRALGADLILAVDTRTLAVRPGDWVVLSSDGLHTSVNGPDFAAAWRAPGADLDLVARRLVKLADERDGRDNISVVLIRIRA